MYIEHKYIYIIEKIENLCLFMKFFLGICHEILYKGFHYSVLNFPFVVSGIYETNLIIFIRLLTIYTNIFSVYFQLMLT